MLQKKSRKPLHKIPLIIPKRKLKSMISATAKLPATTADDEEMSPNRLKLLLSADRESSWSALQETSLWLNFTWPTLDCPPHWNPKSRGIYLLARDLAAEKGLSTAWFQDTFDGYCSRHEPGAWGVHPEEKIIGLEIYKGRRGESRVHGAIAS
jgi:hypothetical protein